MKNNKLVLAIAVMGLFLATVLAALSLERAQEPAQAGSSEDYGALVAVLQRNSLAQERLSVSLEQLTKNFDQQLKGPAELRGTRQPAQASSSDSFGELIASLDALRTTLEQESEQTRQLILAAPDPQNLSLSETRRRNTETIWPALLDLEQSWRSDPGQANRSQYFQTAQDLIRTYGPPTEIFRPKGGILFYYRRHEEGSAGPAWYFRLQDGIVIEFFIEDEEPGDDD